MTFTRVAAAELEPAPGPHPAASVFDKDIGEKLGLQAFGLYQVELPAGAETVRHNHLQDGLQDAYAVIAGSGFVVVDDVELTVHAGDFVAVSPESDRSVRAGPDGLTFIAVCA